MTSVVAHPGVSIRSQVLDNTAQLHRLLEEEGLAPEALQRVIDDPTFRRQLVQFWMGSTPSANASLTVAAAAQIMGAGNFHGPEALTKLGVTMSKTASKKAFGKVPFSAEVLEACRDTHVLVACAGISLMEVWGFQTNLFYAKSDPWYKSQQFATTKVKAGWYLVRKTPVPDSTSNTWEEQLSLLTEVDEVPRASVLAQAILIHYLETDERLFPGIYVRFSDVVSGGVRVYLGRFDQDGLSVDSNWGTYRNSSVGGSASRKLS